MTGVYYLWDGSDVIYIGSSINVKWRMAYHRARGLDFAGYFIEECAVEQLREREFAAIREFKPRFNEANAPGCPVRGDNGVPATLTWSA
jgi:hypothetical protein